MDIEQDQAAISKLVDAFVSESKKQYEASCNGHFRIANKAYDTVSSLFEEIKAFGDHGREALFQITNHPDPSVALMAADYSMEYKPKECMAVYKKIAKLPGLIGFEAQQGLKFNIGNWKKLIK